MFIPTKQLTSFIYQQLLFVSCDIVAGYALRGTGYGVRVTWYGVRGTGYGVRGTGYGVRGTGYKKGLFPIKNSPVCVRTRTGRQPATRNSKHLRDSQTSKLKRRIRIIDKYLCRVIHPVINVYLDTNVDGKL